MPPPTAGGKTSEKLSRLNAPSLWQAVLDANADTRKSVDHFLDSRIVLERKHDCRWHTQQTIIPVNSK